MVKKNQPRPMRSFFPAKSKRHLEESRINFKEILTILASSVGIIGGLLWMGGRFFATGYFGVMGIQLFFLNFSIGEYGETYALSVLHDLVELSWPILEFVLGLVVITIILELINKYWITPKIREVITNIDKFFSIPLFRNLPVVLTIFSSLMIILWTFNSAFYRGESSGSQFVTEYNSTLTIYSKELLPIGSPSVITIQSQNVTLYEYAGLRLLTYNSGKYFVFREVDHPSCKPKQIFIIPDNDLMTVTINTIPLTKTPCPLSVFTPIPSLTATP